MGTDFKPNWTSAPGETISDILMEKCLSEKDLCHLLDMNGTDVKLLMSGKMRINQKLALKLEFSIGASADFWLNRDSQYVKDTIRLNGMMVDKKYPNQKYPVFILRKGIHLSLVRNIADAEDTWDVMSNRLTPLEDNEIDEIFADKNAVIPF